jgi:hypothetical protein
VSTGNGNGNGNGNGYRNGTMPGIVDHLPPQNQEAERALLGALLIEPGRMDSVLEIVAIEDFYRDAHQVLFRCLSDLWQAGKRFDVVMIADELERRGQYREIGGDEFMREIAGAAPSAANMLYHAEIIVQKSIARQLIQGCTETIRDGYSNQYTAGELHARLFSRMNPLGELSDEEEEIRLLPRPDYPGPAAWRGLAGDLVNKMKEKTEAHPAALLVQFLVMFGNMIGHRPYALVNRTKHHTNLYACVVGPSSVARKGTGADLMEWILSHVDDDWARNRRFNGIASGEGLIERVRDEYCDLQGKLFKGEDDKRALWVESEFESVLAVSARDHSVVSPKIRQLWDKCEAASASKNNPSKTTDAHVSIIGHCTEIALSERLKSIEAANGFGNRFLWCFSERTQLLPDGAEFTREEFREEIDGLQYAAAAVGGLADRPFIRDDLARELWYSQYESMSSPPPGVYGAMVSRAAPQVLRLSLIYAILDHSTIVRRSHLESALAVWEYCRQSASYLFADQMGDPGAEKILAAIDAAGVPVTRRQLNRAAFSGRCPETKLVRILDRLRRQGMIEQTTGQGSTARARSCQRWQRRTSNLEMRLCHLRHLPQNVVPTPDDKPF